MMTPAIVQRGDSLSRALAVDVLLDHPLELAGAVIVAVIMVVLWELAYDWQRHEEHAAMTAEAAQRELAEREYVDACARAGQEAQRRMLVVPPQSERDALIRMGVYGLGEQLEEGGARRLPPADATRPMQRDDLLVTPSDSADAGQARADAGRVPRSAVRIEKLPLRDAYVLHHEDGTREEIDGPQLRARRTI